jgi:hypothetical protein
MARSQLTWRKSSYSINADNACVEVAHPSLALVLARDSKLAAGPRVDFTAEAWAAFLRRLPQREAL